MFVNFYTTNCIVFVVAFILSFNVNALVHRLEIKVPDGEPMVKERFSNINSNGNNSNGNALSREVINHVHHKHEQTVGNVHIVTNIDIANLITILNMSTPITGQSTNVPPPPTMTTTVAAATVPENSKSNPSKIIFTDDPEQFKRRERNRGIDEKPFKFPKTSTNVENSRRVRWPHERHSAQALDLSAPINPRIVFPRSQTNIKSSDNDELPMVENTEIDVQPSVIAIAPKINESTVQNTVPFVLESINTTVFIVNKTAEQNELMPMIYIDDDGIFQVKYIPKGENISISNADQHQQQHQQKPNSTSINKSEEIAIISNDNQQIHIKLDQHIHSETNVVNSTEAAAAAVPEATQAPTIDLIQDHAINNIKPIHEQFGEHTERTTLRPIQQQQHQPNRLSTDDKHPTLYNELPIFT